MSEPESAKKILGEILESVQRDVREILKLQNEAFKKSKQVSNIWTLPRILFPEIDGIARLRYGVTGVSGKEIAEAAVKFMKHYFRDKKEYEKLAGFQYVMYRHTLLHSHYPRTLWMNHGLVNWVVTGGRIGNVAPTRSNKKNIVLDGNYLFENFIFATRKYIKEFDDPNLCADLSNKFSLAWGAMNSPVREDFLRRNLAIAPTDFDYFG